MRILFLLGCGLWLAAALPAQALDLAVGPQPLERALVKQLFSAPDGRFYLRGKRDSAGCYLYAQDPQLQFGGDRIELRLHLSGKVGGSFGGACLGVNWSGDAQVSMLPEAEGSDIGFTDVRVEKLTSDRELDQLLAPLLTTLVPKTLKVNAATLISKMLQSAGTRSGTAITLNRLVLTSLAVEGDVLHLVLEGVVTIE